MCIGPQADLPNPRQQLAEFRFAGKVCAQGQGVDEKPDHFFEFGATLAGNGRADDEIILPRNAEKQHIKSGQQRHVERHIVSPAKFAQRLVRAIGGLDE